jgi:D-alanyl-D-alanine carboxypeptidase (penicillin-binding protein 5/6)
MIKTAMNRGKRARRSLPYALLAVLIAAYGYWTLGRPLPTLQPISTPSSLTLQTGPAAINWPAKGQAAVSVVGDGKIITHGNQAPVPTASTAKILTSLVVLNKKPLTKGQSGPVITLGQNDVDLYSQYLAKDGSVVPVAAGEQISEYQALQTVLLPSANNMADSLAIWAFGSLNAYAAAAQQYLAAHGLTHTHVGSDASGLAPTTTSTAHDLAALGALAMQNPLLAEIVGQSSAAGIPVAGNIKNVNFLLGSNGVVGVKTGNSDQAGGVFVGAAQTQLAGKPVTIVTAYAAAPDLFTAVKGSLPMITSAQANFKPSVAMPAGSIVGYYKTLDGHKLPVVTSDSATLIAWQSSTLKARVGLDPISPNTRARTIVGTLNVQPTATSTGETIGLVLEQTAHPPTTWWRLTHPF